MIKRTISLAMVGIAASAFAQTDPNTVERIVDTGKNKNQVMKTLGHLTQKIGPRLTGSPQLAKAQEWAMSEFKRYGLKNVHLEEWGTVPVGFYRGDRQVGKMVAPFETDIKFTTMNWMPGTNGAVRADAIMYPKSIEDLNANKDKFKGKWLVMPQRSGMRGATVPNDDLAKAVDELGIAGRIFGTQDDRVHSSGNWREKSYENRPTQVNVVVSKSDYDRIVRNIDFGRETVLEFDIENKWVKGPVKQYNVIADIPGTDKPDEMVIVCGHLDSWNTPGSQGANDNGTGSSVALEAARILMASGAKPRRTIRFILWSGEEQGLLGSRAYVDKRKDTGEIEKIVALLNDDGGTNYQGGYQALPTQKAILEAAFAPTVAAFPDMPMKVDVVNTTPRGGSSDHAPFAWAGVPAYFTVETGRADYGYVWHTQHDKIDFSIPEYLTQSSTNHAVVAYHLASIPETLARFPKVDRSADWTAPLPVGANMVYEDIDLHSAGKGSHDHEDDYLLELVDRIRRFGKAIISSF